MEDQISPRLIRAAGGIVWDGEPWQSRIAVIHRPRYDDWCLPKGKLDEGESFEDAAVREIREETGLPVRLGSYAGTVTYQVRGRPKEVRFWHAAVIGPSDFQPSEEVDRVEWLSIPDALKRLDHADERQLLATS